MTYTLQISYPKEEMVYDKKNTVVTKKDTVTELVFDEIIDNYRIYEKAGYKIAAKVTPRTEEYDVFEIAKRLFESGVSYKAILKYKGVLDFESAKLVTNILDQGNWSYEVAVKLKVNENTTTDFAKINTWEDGSEFVIKPKVTVTDIGEIKSLYDRLTELEVAHEVDIEVKPSMKEIDFPTRLSLYPEESDVTFKLTEAEVTE